MTAHGLTRIVAQELARVGIQPKEIATFGRPRRTSWSKTLPGFGIRYYASGRRVYIVQTAIGGRTRTITVGNAQLFTTKEATDVARRILLRVQTGGDPATTRKRKRAAPEFAVFLNRYWKAASPGWKPRTLATHDGYRRNHIDGAFDRRFIDDIDQADIARWFAGISDRSGPGAANRCLEIMRAMMNRAEAWGLRPEGSNPCSGVRMNRRRKCERFLNGPELTRLGGVLSAARETDLEQATAITMMLLTGCRKSEVLGLRWSWIKGQRIQLPDSKTGPRTVWIGAEVRRLLHALPRRRDGDEVFWDQARNKPIRSVDHLWRELRCRAGLAGVRLHDLRHSFASHAAGLSETLPMIGRLLGHAKIASTARYAHLDDNSVLHAADVVGALIRKRIGSPCAKEEM